MNAGGNGNSTSVFPHMPNVVNFDNEANHSNSKYDFIYTYIFFLTIHRKGSKIVNK